MVGQCNPEVGKKWCNRKQKRLIPLQHGSDWHRCNIQAVATAAASASYVLKTGGPSFLKRAELRRRISILKENPCSKLLFRHGKNNCFQAGRANLHIQKKKLVLLQMVHEAFLLTFQKCHFQGHGSLTIIQASKAHPWASCDFFQALDARRSWNISAEGGSWHFEEAVHTRM